MKFWLVKSESSVYSIQDLKDEGRAHWDGVRNYQARNFMRDEMAIGDMVLYYHSRDEPIGVAGIARVCKASYADHTSWDPDSKYFDPKSTPENPRWFMVDLEFVEEFDRVLPLSELKQDDKLDGMLVIKRGQRLSIQPVDKKHYKRVLKLAGATTSV